MASADMSTGTAAALHREEGRHARALARQCPHPRAEAGGGDRPDRRLPHQPLRPGAPVRRRRHEPRRGPPARPSSPWSPRASRPAAMKAMAGRVDQPLPVGNEGAGVVVRAGASAGRAGAARQDGRHPRRRDVRAVPLHQGRASAWCCRRAPRRPRAPPASSTRSPRSAWSRPCARRATRRSCTPRPRPTSGRCSTRSASRTASPW